MAANENYPSHVLLFLIRLSASHYGFKTDYEGLTSLGLEIVEKLKLKKGKDDGHIDEKYLVRKYNESVKQLAEGGTVSAKKDKINSVLRFNNYNTPEDFTEKVEALFQLYKNAPLDYTLNKITEEDQKIFRDHLSPYSLQFVRHESVQNALIFMLIDNEGEPSVINDQALYLKFVRNSGQLDGRILEDINPLVFSAIALDIYLQLPETLIRIDELTQPVKEKTSPPAMRHLPAIPPPQARRPFPFWKKAFIIISLILISLVTVYMIYLRPASDKPSTGEIRIGIADREEEMVALVRQASYQTGKEKDTLDDNLAVIWIETLFDSTQAYYRNYYGYTNGFEVVEFKKNIAPVIEIDPDKINPWNKFGFERPVYTSWESVYDDPDTTLRAFYISLGITETARSEPRVVVERRISSYEYQVNIRYKRPIRYLGIQYTFGRETNYYKTRTYNWVGFLPEERLLFKKSGKDWVYAGVQP
jgi:hypothetical protein